MNSNESSILRVGDVRMLIFVLLFAMFAMFCEYAFLVFAMSSCF